MLCVFDQSKNLSSWSVAYEDGVTHIFLHLRGLEPGTHCLGVAVSEGFAGLLSPAVLGLKGRGSFGLLEAD